MSTRPAQVEHLRHVIRDLNDAVIDPAIWANIMERLCTALGATGAMLMQSNTRTPDVPRTASMEAGLRCYFDEGWHNRDLLARGAGLLLRGEKVFLTQDVVTQEEMRREPFFHEVLYRHGVCWTAGVGVQSGAGLWVLSVQKSRREGLFETSDKRIRIYPLPCHGAQSLNPCAHGTD